MNISQTKLLKLLSVHEHTHQMQTYCEDKKKNHGTVPLMARVISVKENLPFYFQHLICFNSLHIVRDATCSEHWLWLRYSKDEILFPEYQIEKHVDFFPLKKLLRRLALLNLTSQYIYYFRSWLALNQYY